MTTEQHGIADISQTLYDRVTKYHAQIGHAVPKDTLQSLARAAARRRGLPDWRLLLQSARAAVSHIRRLTLKVINLGGALPVARAPRQ